MSKISFLTQIFMIVIAVVIVIIYIKPTFEKIRETQETTTVYITESNKVSDVNLLLKNKIAIVNGVSSSDTEALNRYMPDTVDDVLVMKDILAIFTALKLPLSSISAGSAAGAAALPGVRLVPHTFSITSQMTYSDVKRLLHALEVNDYLLQIDSLNMTPGTTGLVGVSMSLTAFARTTAPVAVSNEESNSENQ